MEDNQLEKLYHYLHKKYKNISTCFITGNTPEYNIKLGIGLCLRAKEYVSEQSTNDNADLISDCAIYNLLVRLIKADKSVEDKDLEQVAILQFMKSLYYDDYTNMNLGDENNDDSDIIDVNL